MMSKLKTEVTKMKKYTANYSRSWRGNEYGITMEIEAMTYRSAVNKAMKIARSSWKKELMLISVVEN